VRDRCNEKKIAVLLSGGLDSRLIMAAVPKSADCIGLTFCNGPNRETRTASQVAKCYNRSWYPVIREREYLGNGVVKIVKMVGCEFDWVEGQAAGSAYKINEFSLNVILHGLMFDVYLKGAYAFDWVCVRHLGGLLPVTFIRNKIFDYIDNLQPFWKEHLKSDIIQQVYERRKDFYQNSRLSGRGSIAEWLKVYPFSQDSAAEWSTERRLFPVRLVAADKRILNFAFKYPIGLKLSRKIFLQIMKNICGKGLSIPSANDGVRPGSGYWWRLPQRAIRKLEDGTTKVLEKLGKKPIIQHSWHDYQKYWWESKKLKELISKYGSNLSELDGTLFQGRSRDLLLYKDLFWRNGFRLLQLAIWKELLSNYKCDTTNGNYAVIDWWIS
jgi:hypothetical protein